MSDPTWLTDFDREMAEVQEVEKEKIRADAREQCRAELLAKIDEFEGETWWLFDDAEIWRHFRDWAGEAFKG